MSTKNLARTIIEGGRHKGNKWERRNSHAEERAALKNYLKEVELDPENFEEYDPEPIQYVYKGFDDKLGPIFRWLNRQVGRPWDEVRADVAQEFDTRTTAGRHIVYDHMLDSVEITPEVRFRYRSVPDDPNASHYKNDFYVDESGILRKKRYIPRNRSSYFAPSCDTNRICNWLNGRIVGKVGNKLFWFIPADKNEKRGGYSQVWKLVWGNHNGYYSYNVDFHFMKLHYKIVYKKNSLGQPIIENGRMVEQERIPEWTYSEPNGLRQSHKLNDKELKFWSTIPAYHRTKILEKSPTYPEELKPKKRYY